MKYIQFFLETKCLIKTPKRNEQDIKQIRKGKRMGLTVILNLCTLICQLIILATFIRSENK